MTQCVNSNETGVSLLKRDTGDMVDHQSMLPFLYSHSFSSSLGCFFSTIIQLHNWLVNILAGLNFKAQEIDQCHQTVFVLLAQAQLGTRLVKP